LALKLYLINKLNDDELIFGIGIPSKYILGLRKATDLHIKKFYANHHHTCNDKDKHSSTIGSSSSSIVIPKDRISTQINGFCSHHNMAIDAGRIIRRNHVNCRVISIGPNSSSLLWNGYEVIYDVNGCQAGYLLPKCDADIASYINNLPHQDSINMVKRLSKYEGILTRSSTGLNVLCALKLAEEIGSGGVVVTVACDNGLY